MVPTPRFGVDRTKLRRSEVPEPVENLTGEKGVHPGIGSAFLRRMDDPRQRTLFGCIPAMATRMDRGITGYDRRGRAAPMRPWAEVGPRATTIAWHLHRSLADSPAPAGGPNGKRVVMLQLPNSATLLEHFFGAIGAGMLPMCLAPMRALGGVDAFRSRIESLRGAFPGALLVADQEHGAAAGGEFLEPLDPGAMGAEPGAAAEEGLPTQEPDPEDIAFLQLTSGSTHTPKAVQISHRAAWAQIHGIRDALRLPGDCAGVTWLPLYHDMGLVGCTLLPAMLGVDLHLFRPETFLSRPLAWLKAVSDLKQPVLNSAPDFALRHCVERVPQEQVGSLDLSNWYWLGCGAERVRPETLAAFSAHFRDSGFKEVAFGPCYGLAEATLAVTIHPPGEPILERDGQVGCGPPLPDTEIRICSPEGALLGPGQQGEVQLRCPSLFSGYTGFSGTGTDQPEALGPGAVGIDPDGWLHTGDRGFLRDGELFLTGRLKDLIIVDGENFAPEDIEWIADSVVQESGARHAAFSVSQGGREGAVLVVEASAERASEADSWREAIGTAVAQRVGLPLKEIRFVRRGSLPKTSSGKIRRNAVHDAWRANSLVELATGSDRA